MWVDRGLVTGELGSFDLQKALWAGLMPSHYLSPDSELDLKAYVHDYLKEEIQAEALTRNFPAFSRFLQTAAITNGMLLNYSNAARESGVSVKTIREYYQILDDTLIGRLLFPWKKSRKRRLIETAKFFSLILALFQPSWVTKSCPRVLQNMAGYSNISFFKNAGPTGITVDWIFR